jgi:hypothetical protein
MPHEATADIKPDTIAQQATSPAPAATIDTKPATAAEPSILDDVTEGSGKPEPASAHPATWPEKWREELAGTDEKLLGQLKRLASPKDLWTSYRSLQQKLSSGEYTKKLPDNATDAQKAEWRKENGIPEKPTDYKLPEIQGFEWSEADKPIVGSFIEALHSADVPQGVVDKALGWYAEFTGQQREAQFEADKSSKQTAEDALRTEFGNEYRPSINLLGRYLKDADVFPNDLGTQILTARTADGSRLINNPDLIRLLVGQARDKYGETSMISANEATALSSREDEIIKIMNTDIDRYWREKNAKGQSMQEELAEIQARKSGKPRAA